VEPSEQGGVFRGPINVAPALGLAALVVTAASVAAGKVHTATAAKEDLGGEAGAALVLGVANVGGGLWPGRLVWGEVVAAVDGGGPWLLRGEYRYAEATWHRAVQYPLAQKCPWRFWQPQRSCWEAGKWVKHLMLGKGVGLWRHQ